MSRLFFRVFIDTIFFVKTEFLRLRCLLNAFKRDLLADDNRRPENLFFLAS